MLNALLAAGPTIQALAILIPIISAILLWTRRRWVKRLAAARDEADAWREAYRAAERARADGVDLLREAITSVRDVTTSMEKRKR